MDKFEMLLRRVEITRKCRIKASERLKKWDGLSQFFMVYYSLAIVCLSIMNFSPKFSNDGLDLKLLIASVCLTIFSIYVTSKKFNERAIGFKCNYIEMARLLSELEKIDPNDTEAICLIEHKYYTILEAVENHSDYDYLLTMCGIDEERKKLKGFKKLKILWYFIFDKLLIIILFVLPILLILISISGLR